ncbi:MAG: WYL domain-containing protein [Anaerolineae bacterium]|nr:WYL domain-containing protein [Anaerolineae bacterium]
MNVKLTGSDRPEDIKRVARILEIVQIIAAAPQRYLRRDLATRFEVSERMIQKDLEVIRHGLVLPLEHSPEGYYFERMPRLPALQYTFSEALALLLAVQAAQRISGIGSAELAAATARLEALFPAEFVPLLRQHGQRQLPTVQGEHRRQMLTLLNRALVEGRKVKMIYATRSRGGEHSERVVRPYTLYPYVRSWQLIAYCERRDEVLMFKVDRIHSATLLDEPYTIPDDFDVDAYIGDTWGLLRGEGGEPVQVMLRFAADAGQRVAEERWHASQQAEVQPDGSVLFRLHIAVTPEFVSWVLYYGCQVEVLAPESLRKRVVEEHRKAMEVNEIC